MDQILEQSSEAEYHQDPQSNKASQFNALSKRSKDGSIGSLENRKDIELDLKKQKWESQIKNQIKINCKFSDDDFDSSDKKHNQAEISDDSFEYNHSNFKKDNYKIDNFKFENDENKKHSLDQTSDFEDFSQEQPIKKSTFKQMNNLIESHNLSLSYDSDDQNLKNEQRQSKKKEYLFQKDSIQNKYLNQCQVKQDIISHLVQNKQDIINQNGQSTFVDKSVSDQELEDSLQDLKKDTFYNLLQQLDQEREKNKLMEQKIMSRDKSFFEIKSQFNELLLNYESKQKECELLKKNQSYANTQNLNQTNQSMSSLKTNKKNIPITERSNAENSTSIEKKYNQLLSKYKNDSEFEDSDQENETLHTNYKNDTTQKQSQEFNIKHKINLQHISENKIRKNSYQDSQNDDTQQSRQNSEIDLLEMKMQRQREELARLTKQLDDEKYNKLKMTQKIADLEKQIQNQQHQKDEKDKNNIIQLQQNNTLLIKQLEEQTENQKLLQLEMKEIKDLLKKKDQKINELQSDDKDNQSLLAKAEKLLKQYENLKEEYCLKCQEADHLKQENGQLKEIKQDHKLKVFIDQQDQLIQRLNVELENQKQDYEIQIDQATRNMLDLIQRLFGEKGEYYCQPENSCIWISQIFGKEEKQVNKQNHGNSSKSENQEFVDYGTILKEVESLQKDYSRYKEFAKVFKDMIKSIAKNELNQQPTLKDCWKYFKWLYNQYIKLKLEDQMNQSTTRILLKMLKLQNDHEIILAVQNLITQNDRLRHMQQLIAHQNVNQLQQNNQQFNYYNQSNLTKQDNNLNYQMQQEQNQFYNFDKENKFQGSLKQQDNSKRSKSPATTANRFNLNSRNTNNNSFQNSSQQSNNGTRVESQKQLIKPNPNKFSQDPKQFLNKTQNHDKVQNNYQSFNTQSDQYSSFNQNYQPGEFIPGQQQQYNQIPNNFQARRIQNNRSLPRLQNNYFD